MEPSQKNEPQNPTADSDRHRQRSSMIVRLAAWTVAIAVIWFLFLPMWASQPEMAEHLQWLDDRGIDPSAMYYTELDAMKPILARFNERNRSRQNLKR